MIISRYVSTKLILLTFFINSISISAQQNNFDSLMHLSTTTTDSVVADKLYDLAKLVFSSNIDSALLLTKRSVELSERLNYIPGMINAYRGITYMSVRTGSLDESLEYVDKGIDLIKRENLGNKEHLNFLINKGAAYLYVSKLSKTLETNLEAYRFAILNGMNEKAGSLINNMGILYRKQGKYDDAINMYKKCIEFRKENLDTLGLGNCYFNLGATYAKIDSSEKTMEVINEARKLYKSLGRKNDVQHCDFAFGTAAFDLEQFETAYDYLSPIEKDPLFKTNAVETYKIHLYLAEIGIQKNNLIEARRLLNDIVDIEESEYEEEKVAYFRNRSHLEELSKNYASALEYRDRYIEGFNTFQNIENASYREELETQYKTAEKDFEIDQLEKEQQLTEVKLNAARQRNYGFGIGLFLLAGFVWFLQRLNKKIQRQHTIISKANKDKEILLQEIHHRVKNNLQVISSLLSMQERKVKDEDTKDALRSSKSRVQSMSILHQNLYQGENLKDIEVDKYIRDLIENIEATYQTDTQIKFNLDLDKLSLDVDSLIPIGLISNELICNAIKHAFIGRDIGQLNVSLKETDKEVTLTVSDNGVGMENNAFEKKRDSLGVRLIKSFTDRMDGRLEMTQNNGTTVRVEFDKKYLNLES